MEKDLKNVIRLINSDDNKNKRVAAVVLSSESFDFFCKFVEYYAERAVQILKEEKNAQSFVYHFGIETNNLEIEIDFENDEQIYFAYVKINNSNFLTMAKRNEQFVFQSRKPDYSKYIYSIYGS